MTKRTPISAEQNIWFDAQQVDNDNLSLEQNYNSTITSGIINNHIGTGVIPQNLLQNIIFDSEKTITSNGFLDGKPINAQNQPSDTNFGNFLEIELANSSASVKRTVKIAVIGLDFENNLQYETFYFKKNEVQVSKKHFVKVLTILFNDFIGQPALSLNLGGRVIIKEASPMLLSRDPIMLSQDLEPNLFFRDFFVDGFASLDALLQSALPYYNISNLNITTSENEKKVLLRGDVTTQIGQKFLATTNNIQKLTLLLSVEKYNITEPDLKWNGDIIVSIYPLQSSIDCPTDFMPNLDIDFAPNNIPLAQLSFNYGTLEQLGVILDTVPQPVDFVFSNSDVAGGNIITPGKYYAFTIKRSGSANKSNILVCAGTNRVENSRPTMFNGNVWVDFPEEDLWFKIWTDAAKLSDGQAYDTGHGVEIPKIISDPILNSNIDYVLDQIYFSGNDVYRGIVSAAIKESLPIPDERTGNPVFSRKQFVPKLSLLNNIEVSNLTKSSEPLIIGAITDKNKKYYDSLSSEISSSLYGSLIVKNSLFVKIVTDNTDPRYNTNVTDLQSNLLNGDFVGAKIFPNSNDYSKFYRVADAQLCNMILGDLDGDGLVTENDLILLNSYVGFNFNISPPLNSVITTVGSNTTFTNGYLNYLSPFSAATGLNFQVVDKYTGDIVASSNDGILAPDPQNIRLANFTSANVSFAPILASGTFKLVIDIPTNQENCGGFDIIGNNVTTDVITIRKIFLDEQIMTQLIAADIDGDFAITNNDYILLESKIQQASSPTSNPVYPAPTTDAYDKIGKSFSIIKFSLEQFIDRADDYSSLIIGRPQVTHVLPDIVIADTYLQSHDFYATPVPLLIQKQLTWDESLIVSAGKSKLVPGVFNKLTGFIPVDCNIPGIMCDSYEDKPDFDPGKTDYFVPNDLVIGETGELRRANGDFYRVDFEVGTIILEIPDGMFEEEKTIDIFEDFVYDYTGKGVTKLGFPALKFADCTTVKSNALGLDQLRFSVAVQSFSPNTNGLSVEGFYGAIVDGKMGVSIDHQSGLLTLNFTNLLQDTVLKTVSTKIQINVFLKKAGFNNKPLFVDSGKIENMLNLIGVFSGANLAGTANFVELESDVSGILPIIHGGTGLDNVGVSGTVLCSVGSGLAYKFLSELDGVIAFSTGEPDADKVVKTDYYGKLDPSLTYKNPVYIYGVSGLYTTTTSSPGVVVGALTFRFDSFILQGVYSIKLEAVLKGSGGASAELSLECVSPATTIDLVSGSSTVLSSSSTDYTAVFSANLADQLLAGASNYVYVLKLSSSDGVNSVDCAMARLVITYSNPSAENPPANSFNFVPYFPV